ncbi:MAG: UDP-2,4-diacetamido-2,4,6-trideoxy-beta-L-altropyranose hydrolase [Vulcanimicrobiota bacterium]
MPGPTILIRADAGPQIGGGHVVRTCALGQELLKAGFEVILATRRETLATIPFLNSSGFRLLVVECESPSELQFLKDHLEDRVSAVIVDHYERDASFESGCREFTDLVLALDDIPQRAHDCDILLDQTLGRMANEYSALVPSHCRVLAGTDYALLRPQFREARTSFGSEPRRCLNRILLMTGATDPQDLCGWVLEAIAALTAPLAVDIIGGGLTSDRQADFQSRCSHELNFHGNVSDVSKLMRTTDLAVGACGSASWERACLGLPSLLFVIADNQLDICRALESTGIAKNLGWVREASPHEFRRLITELHTDPSWLTAASKKAYEVCDGRGAERVAAILQETLSSGRTL